MSDIKNKLQDIRDSIDSLPLIAAEAIRDQVPSNTPFGQAVHTEGALEDFLSGLGNDDLEAIGDAIINANKAVGETMLHTPDFDALMTFISHAAILSEGDVESPYFYQSMQVSQPIIPTLNHSTGELMAAHHLYDQKTETPYSVIGQAKEALADETLSEADRDYWIDTVLGEFPHLREKLPYLTLDDIPDGDDQVYAAEQDQFRNEIQAKSAGLALQAMGAPNSSGMPDDDPNVITLESALDFVEEREANPSDGERILAGGGDYGQL